MTEKTVGIYVGDCRHVEIPESVYNGAFALIRFFKEKNIQNWEFAGLQEVRYEDSRATGRTAKQIKWLAECFKAAGADSDGDEDWRIAPRAVDAVKELRKDYDDACTEVCDLHKALTDIRDATHKSALILRAAADRAITKLGVRK